MIRISTALPFEFFNNAEKEAHKMLRRRVCIIYFSFGENAIFDPLLGMCEVWSVQNDPNSRLTVRGPILEYAENYRHGKPDLVIESNPNTDSVILYADALGRGLLIDERFIASVCLDYAGFRVHVLLDDSIYDVVRFIEVMQVMYSMTLKPEKSICVARKASEKWQVSRASTE